MQAYHSRRGTFLVLPLVAAFALASSASALPTDSFHLGFTGEPQSQTWAASAFYHLAPSSGGVGVRADLGFQLLRFLGESRSAATVLHAQSDSLVIGYAHLAKPIWSFPTRWVVGVDLRSPFSYLLEAQIFRAFERWQPYLALRVQSTGYSVEGGDGALFTTGSATRYWLGSASFGVIYHAVRDLNLAASATYRAALGSTDFRDPAVYHLSMQWLWGAPGAP